MMRGAGDEIITQEEINFLNTYQNKYPKDQLKKFTDILEVFNTGDKLGAKRLLDALLPTEKPNYELFKSDLRRVKEIKEKQKRMKQTLSELQAEQDRLAANIGNLHIQRKEIINQGASQLVADMNSYTAPASSASASATASSRTVGVPGGRK